MICVSMLYVFMIYVYVDSTSAQTLSRFILPVKEMQQYDAIRVALQNIEESLTRVLGAIESSIEWEDVMIHERRVEVHKIIYIG